MKPIKLTNNRYAWRCDDMLRHEYSVLSIVFHLMQGQIETNSYISYVTEDDARVDLLRAKRKLNKFLELRY